MANEKIIFLTSPIGDLGDTSYNLINYIKIADVLVVETLEKAKVLFEYYNLDVKADIIAINPVAFFEEKDDVVRQNLENNFLSDLKNQIMNYISEGKLVVCMSDSGSAIIQDPFNEIKNEVILKEIPYKITAGPSSIISSLEHSNLYGGESFMFFGMVYYDKNKDLIYKQITESSIVSVLFYHVEIKDAFFEELKNALGSERKVTLVSNVTSEEHQVIKEGTLIEIIDFTNQVICGEPTLIISGAQQ
jgi:16S rRNA (cytidine1402-2'-O)-methyltransferase